jgi:mannose-1-phosphate guanylyltransferase
MRERVTLTLDKNLLTQIDDGVDGYNIKNRSHAIEILLLKALKSDRPSKALILAGGKNTLLKLDSGSVPKHLLMINKKPLIEHTVELFRKFGVRDIIISINKGDAATKKIFEGRDMGANITFLEEEFPMGTSGPIRLASKMLNTTFFVSNGDDLKSLDLQDMYFFHKENRGLVTIALSSTDDPSKYGVANLNGNHIMEFVEKPKKQNAPSNLISAGLYIMEPDVLNYMPDGFGKLEEEVFPKLASEKSLIGYSFIGQWMSVNSQEEYQAAIKKWKGIE